MCNSELLSGMGDTKSLVIPYVPVDGSSPEKTKYSKRVFTLSEKAALINCSETERLSVKELTERFRCGKTAVYDILKRKSEILEQCLLGAGSRKRKFRKTGNEEVNKAVWQWFVEAKSNNFNVTGPLLQAQAKLTAEHLGKTDFKASNGWLDSFRTRHSISFKQRSAEATQVCPVTHTEWDEYCEKQEFVDVKREQEGTNIVDLQSSPVSSRVDGDLESSSSSPVTPPVPCPLLSGTSRPETPSVSCTMLPTSFQRPTAESSVLNTNQVAGVNSYKDERTLETLQTKEREHQRRLEIMEKEHEMRLEILRIEKETAEINRDVARKQLLWLSENRSYSSQLGDLGSGAGKGGGGGGSIREAGGAFGKMEAGREEEYFYKQQKEQLKKLKEGLEDEISFHEEQVKRHQEAIQRHKHRVKEIESKGKH